MPGVWPMKSESDEQSEGCVPGVHMLSVVELLNTRPNGQTEHDEEPGDEKLLDGQGVHAEAFLDENEFGGQGMQAELAAAEYVPAGQNAHVFGDAAAVVDEYVPAGHCMQLLDDVIPGEVE